MHRPFSYPSKMPRSSDLVIHFYRRGLIEYHYYFYRYFAHSRFYTTSSPCPKRSRKNWPAEPGWILLTLQNIHAWISPPGCLAKARWIPQWGPQQKHTFNYHLQNATRMKFCANLLSYEHLHVELNNGLNQRPLRVICRREPKKWRFRLCKSIKLLSWFQFYCFCPRLLEE